MRIEKERQRIKEAEQEEATKLGLREAKIDIVVDNHSSANSSDRSVSPPMKKAPAPRKVYEFQKPELPMKKELA